MRLHMRFSLCYVLSVTLIIISTSACDTPSASDITLSPGDLKTAYWSLTLNHTAINLSTVEPFDTVQLIATPRNMYGEALTGLSEIPTFEVSDTRRLLVDDMGLVSALGTGTQFRIIATLQIGEVTHQDTAFVNVTSTAPVSPLDHISIQPVPPDSAKWSMGFDGGKTIYPQMIGVDGRPLQNSTGGDLTGLLIRYVSSNMNVVSIPNPYENILYAALMGKSLITASTYAYGVARKDTVTFTIGLPTVAIIFVRERGSKTYFDPTTVTMAAGGLVFFVTSSENKRTAAILFDNPEFALPGYFDGHGNVDSLPPGTSFGSISRTFNRTGTHIFRDAQRQATGTIIIGTNEQ